MHTLSNARKTYAARPPVSYDVYADEQIIMLRDLAQTTANMQLAEVTRYNEMLRARDEARRAAESDEETK
jgi:sensor histidine kinase regulating citrate/malate metabolism